MGIPDYRRQTTTSYGTAAQATRAAAAASVGFITIANLTGRGIIYGGYILASNTITDTTRKADRIRVTQDGAIIHFMSLTNTASRGLGHPGPAPVYLILYGDEKFNYRIGITPGITFDSTWLLEYEVRTTDIDVLEGGVNYALAG